MILHSYRSLAFFAGLKDEDLEALGPFFTSSNLVAGTHLFEQGDQAENLYLVASGEVVIRYKPEDGPVMTVTHVLPGSVFGWSAAVGNGVYTSGAQCSLDSEILQIPGLELRRLCQGCPRIGDVLVDRLALVMADRKRNRLGQVSSILMDGMRQANGSGGA